MKLKLNLLAQIKKQKENQRKTQKIIHGELTKIETLRISIEGIQTLSDSSIKSIQERREKAVKAINKATDELSILAKTMKNIENRIRKINHE